MNPWESVSHRLRDMSITAKFGFGAALLLSLIVLVFLTGCLSIEFVRDAQESILASREIQRLVLEMDRGMEKARRLHGDFFLQYPQIGLAKAHELYAQPSVRQIARVITVINDLKELIFQSKASEALRKSHIDLNLYLSSAKRFADTSIESVELVTELAAPERGLEAQLEDRLAHLRWEAASVSNLARYCREMKSFAQDYRITRKRYLMQSAFNSAFNLREEAARTPSVTEEQRKRINDLLDQCIATAEKILEVDVAIRSKFNDFALQAEAADTVSTTLVRVAGEEVAQARSRIINSHATAIILMAAITLTGLIVAAGIAIILNSVITRRVVSLTASAAELRRGNLDVFAAEEGMDELGQLARTFNVMAARIKDLIQGLEQKVERRTAELAESERRFRELFQHSSSGVVVYEAVEEGEDFCIKDVNKAVQRIEDVTRQDVVGKKVTQAFPGVGEFGLLDVLRRVWKTGESARHPASFYSDGRLEGWRENAVYKLPSGEVVAVYDDLTAQKQAEIEKKAMEGKLQRAQKMETIGLMAGGVAHDLNNILSGIIGYPDLLLLQLPGESKLRRPIEAMRESGQRAAAVVADLLTVARGVANSKAPANLNNLIKEHLSSPEHQRLSALYKGIDCITQLDERLDNIYCSAIHIKKCIMNLLINSIEAIDGSGCITIITRNWNVNEKFAFDNGIQSGAYVVLEISDNGKGIARSDLDRIFEPFYTKKVMGRSGTGLGLTVVWNSVIDHNGTVLVDSSAKGTSFKLYFPSCI